MMLPKTFEEYVADRVPDAAQRGDDCDQCGASGPLLSDGYCDVCLKYHWGYDQAEAQFVMAMIGSAVTGALEAGATAELVAFAFRRAMKGERDWDDNVPFSDWTYETVREAIEAGPSPSSVRVPRHP